MWRCDAGGGSLGADAGAGGRWAWVVDSKTKKSPLLRAGKSILWEGGGDREHYTHGLSRAEMIISNNKYQFCE